MADLTCNARQVLEARYLRRDTDGQITETPEELFRRVARAVAVAEATHGGPSVVGHWTEVFEQLLASLDFLPNSPTLMNAGTTLGQLSACFVLPVEDSIDGIFDSLKLMALIQQSGGGTGFSFSRLRPQGDFVTSTGGIASGPVSFIRLYDAATENIRQGGKRRGANMGVLRVDHPDIEEFIDAKLDDTGFRNFNLSVGATDQFMEAVASNQSFPLRHPGTGKEIRAISAGGLMQRIVDNAVSKTINLPGTAVAKQIGAIYQQAWENGLKGVTVYRYGSKGPQVLNLGTAETPEQHEPFSRCDPDACRL